MAHIDCSYFSMALQKNAHFIACIPSLLPDDYLEDHEDRYDDIDRKFPTLYLLHGSYGDCTDWDLRTSIERYCQDHQIAVIMPSGENSSYLNMKAGENYLGYIGEELVEFTRKMFPLSRERSETYIAGLSMGGYGAYRIGLEYPETFGKIASLSGALDMVLLHSGPKEAHFAKMPQNYLRAVYDAADSTSVAGTRDDLLTLLETRTQDGTVLPALYMSVGNEDFIKPANDSFYARAQELQVPVLYEHFPGVHSWDYWDAHIIDVLNWIDPRE